MMNRKKRLLTILLTASLAASMAVPAMAAPASVSTSTDQTVKSFAQMTGGWTVAKKNYNADLTAAQLKIFNSAMKGMTGVSYTPIAYLGTQLVAGKNCYYLCRATTVTSSPKTTIKKVCIYQDLQGNTSVKWIKGFSLANHAKDYTIAVPEVGMTGAVTAYTASKKASLPTAAKKAFDRATANLSGASYKPIALLGSQVVAGSNYSILCVETVLGSTLVKKVCVVTIYDVPWMNQSEITSVYDLYVK